MRPADAAAAARRDVKPGDVLAGEGDAAAVGAERAGEHVEQRRLARAIGPDDADRLAGRHPEIDPGKHGERPEAFLEPCGGEQRAFHETAVPVRSRRFTPSRA